MTPLFYWGFLLLLLGGMYASLRLGVMVGRQQEYHARTSPLLAELIWIKEAVEMSPPIANLHIGFRVGELLAKYGLKKKPA